MSGRGRCLDKRLSRYDRTRKDAIILSAVFLAIFPNCYKFRTQCGRRVSGSKQLECTKSDFENSKKKKNDGSTSDPVAANTYGTGN